MTIIMNRAWSMPNRWTFKIPPIAELLARYVGDGKGWIDPFAGMYSPAEITNDLNPDRSTKYHLDALEFLKGLDGNCYKGILFDPPYSGYSANSEERVNDILPAKAQREMQVIEENLSFLADDGEKLLLPAQVVLGSMLGWWVFYILVIDSVFELIEEFYFK